MIIVLELLQGSQFPSAGVLVGHGLGDLNIELVVGSGGIAQTSEIRQFMLYGNGGYVLHPLTVFQRGPALPVIFLTTCGTHLLPRLGEFVV